MNAPYSTRRDEKEGSENRIWTPDDDRIRTWKILIWYTVIMMAMPTSMVNKQASSTVHTVVDDSRRVSLGASTEGVG